MTLLTGGCALVLLASHEAEDVPWGAVALLHVAMAWLEWLNRAARRAAGPRRHAQKAA